MRDGLTLAAALIAAAGLLTGCVKEASMGAAGSSATAVSAAAAEAKPEIFIYSDENPDPEGGQTGILSSR